MRIDMAAACGLMLAGPACAADQLRFGAPPAWVQPGIAAPVAKGEGGAVSLRLIDTQTRFDDAGAHAFVHQILKVNSPEGLQSAGNVSATWQPATDVVTVHKIAITRDGAPIDVLKGGKDFTILRREETIERAMIDGRLTAVLQVPGLRVGDELEFAMTIDQRNPVLQGHIENSGMLVGGAHVGRVRIRQTWPATRALRWREGDALPRAQPTTRGGETEWLFDQSDFTFPELPDNAPGRYADIGKFQVSDFADWQSVSALMAPLFEKAAALSDQSPVRAEIARIAAASSDPAARAGLALTLVQRQIRYLANLTGLGGYVPASADQVWADRAGDCKGKTVLLLALLRGLDIEARPALVSATQPDGVDRSLPMPGRFDHVIVEAVIGGKSHWLDGTRLGDTDLARIVVPPFQWALPIGAPGNGLVALVASAPTKPLAEWRLDLDARRGVLVPAAATGEARFRGDAAVGTRSALLLIDPSAREAAVRKFWEERHDWLTIKTVSFVLDDPSGDLVLRFAGDAPMDWSLKGKDATFRYEANKARLGQDLSPKRKPGPGSDAPVQVNEQYVVTHQTILLPEEGKGFFLEGNPIDEIAGGVHYVRTALLRSGRFDMTASTRTVAHEVSVGEAKAADTASDRIFANQLFVHLPSDYALTAADREKRVAEITADDSTTSRVMALSAKSDFAGALKLLDEAFAKGERNAHLLILRARLLITLKRAADAEGDVDAALAMNGQDPDALMMKASLLMESKRMEDALIPLDRLILLQPQMIFAYQMRAQARLTTNKNEGALSDLEIVLAKQPDNQWARIQQVKLLNQLGRRTDALASAQAYVKLLPEDATSHALLGNMLALLDRRDEAAAELARSIAVAPEADAYATRLRYGLSGGVDQQLNDALAVVRLSPAQTIWPDVLKPIVADPARYGKLMAAYDAAIKAAPGNDDIAGARDRAAAAAGHLEAMTARIDAGVAKDPKNPELRNAACWYRATNAIELPKALADCDAAIATRREAAFLDSRGLVRLRMADYRGAIADYDAALALRPQMSSSLFARGIAHLKAGETAAGRADIAAARKSDVSIDKIYENMNLAAEAPPARP